MNKSNVVIRSLINNVKDEFHGNNVDVPFSTWNFATDELRDQHNVVCEQNIAHKSFHFDILFSIVT